MNVSASSNSISSVCASSRLLSCSCTELVLALQRDGHLLLFDQLEELVLSVIKPVEVVDHQLVILIDLDVLALARLP